MNEPDDGSLDDPAVAPPISAAWAVTEAAVALDEAADQRSVYEMFHRVRERFGLPLFGTSTNIVPGNVAVTAALAAWDYHVTISDRPARRVSLEPRDWIIDHHDPVTVREQPAEIVTAWEQLLGMVTTAAMRARFHHLLHQRGGPTARAHAEQAADAYADAASGWTQEMDSIDDYATSLRLSRAIRDDRRVDHAINNLLSITEQELEREDPRFGVIIRSLDAVFGEPRTPSRFDELIAAAEAAFDSGLDKNRILVMTLARAGTPAEKEQVWERRVRAHIDHAEREELPMLRSIRLLDALKVAEASNVRRLRRLAASLLEQVGDVTTQMMRFRSSSRLYDEQVEEIIGDMSSGDSWPESLVTFAGYPPLTGDRQSNEDLVRHQHQLSPLAAFMPAVFYSPESLPYLQGSDEAARFDIDLAAVEKQHLEQLLRPLATALIRVLHGQVPPPHSVLAGFLAQWPGAVGHGSRLADVLLRYWAGDYDAAGFIVTPLIEAIARGLLAGNGTYVSQRRDTPRSVPSSWHAHPHPRRGPTPGYIARPLPADCSRLRRGHEPSQPGRSRLHGALERTHRRVAHPLRAHAHAATPCTAQR